METISLKCLAAMRWFGYGRWDAPYWFIGKEPGGGDDPESYSAWERLGGLDLVDCREHDLAYRGADAGKWHTWKPPHLQPTWRPLIALLLSYFGATSYERESVRAYQAACWGRLDGETTVLELAAAAANEPDAMRLAHLRQRIATLKAKLAENHPKFVLLYGLGFDLASNMSDVRHWNEIAERTLVENVPVKVGRTVFVYTRHPTAHGIDDRFWIDLGKAIRVEVDA
ncbi:MAG: hypothetical protein ACLPYS_13395 [Vulcanimicrobiaceae bacterium]